MKPSVSARCISVAGGKAAEDFADTGEKAYRAENQREPGPGVQPVIEEIANRGSNDNRANESEGQLKRQGESGVGGNVLSSRCRRRS